MSDPSQNKLVSKVENDRQEVPKQAETKSNGIINLQTDNFNQF